SRSTSCPSRSLPTLTTKPPRPTASGGSGTMPARPTWGSTGRPSSSTRTGTWRGRCSGSSRPGTQCPSSRSSPRRSAKFTQSRESVSLERVSVLSGARWETRWAAPNAALPLRPGLHGPSGDLSHKPGPDGAGRRTGRARRRSAARPIGAERARDLPAGLESALSGRERPHGERRRRRGTGRVGTNGANVRQGVLGVVQARDLDDVARVRRVDELACADVHPLVLRAVRACVEEDDVARP